MHVGYVRTYHNNLADDLTRLSCTECAARYPLDRHPAPEWGLLLDKGWARRAVMWDNQEENDKSTAFQLSVKRSPPGPQANFFELAEISDGLANYARAALALGISANIIALTPRHALPQVLPNRCCGPRDIEWHKKGAILICLTGPLHTKSRETLKKIMPLLSNYDLCLDFVSHQEALKARELLPEVKLQGPFHVTGPDLGDQVRWNRFILATFPLGPFTRDSPCFPTDAIKIPFAPPGHSAHVQDSSLPKGIKFSFAWADNDKNIPADEWHPIESAVKPSSKSHQHTPRRVKWNKGTTPLWSPNQSLPQLHLGSWSPDHDDPLLLLANDGTRYRVIKPLEAARLLDCRRDEAAAKPHIAARCALEATPPSLAKHLVHAYSKKCLQVEGQDNAKVGVCSLPGEHSDEATCFRFVERAHLLPSTPLQHPSEFPHETWEFFEAPDILRISPSIHYAYSFPRRIHDEELAKKELYCAECGARTSTRKGYLAPGCDSIIHADCFLHHLTSCETCKDLCKSLPGLEGTNRFEDLGLTDTQITHHDPAMGAASGGKGATTRKGEIRQPRAPPEAPVNRNNPDHAPDGRGRSGFRSSATRSRSRNLPAEGRATSSTDLRPNAGHLSPQNVFHKANSHPARRRSTKRPIPSLPA